MEHAGRCHCGNMRVLLRLSTEPRATPVRACACSFCRAHGARTVADPDGLLEVRATDWALVEAYGFGLRTADFLVCRRCGVYVAAVCGTPAGHRATANVNALEDRAEFDPNPDPVDYDSETREARLARRAARWTPAILHRRP